MSRAGRSCGCNSAGQRSRTEGTNSALNRYYQEKENTQPPPNRYVDSIPSTRTRTYKEQIVEETSTNMISMTRYSKTVSQQTTYIYPRVQQENVTRAPVAKSNINRLPLTDVNEKYTTQVLRPTRSSNIITSTVRRPVMGASGMSSIRSAASNISSVSSIRSAASNTSSASSIRSGISSVSGGSSVRSAPSTIVRRAIPATVGKRMAPESSARKASQLQLSKQSQYSTRNEPTFTYPTKYELRKVNLDRGDKTVASDEDTDMFYSALSEDGTWLTLEPDFENTVPVPYKENAHFVAPKLRANNSNPSPFPDSMGHSQIIYEGIPSLRKKTLKREVYKPSEYKGIVNLDPHITKVHPLLLYTDYITDIIENLIMKQMKHILQPYFITTYNVRSVHRAAVINWLVKLQQYLGSDSSVLFMCVRLFDKMLSLTEIAPDILQLVGLATYWISCKYSDIIDCPNAAKLTNLCNNAYTVQELWKIENKVLRYLNFEIVVQEPMIFVRYYIYIMQLDNSNIVSICSNYLLDCLILDSECNTYPISLQGAAVVLLSLQLLDIDVRLWKIVEAYPGFYSPDQMSSIHNKILRIVQLVQDADYEFREPYIKYMTEKYASISLKLYNVLNS